MKISEAKPPKECPVCGGASFGLDAKHKTYTCIKCKMELSAVCESRELRDPIGIRVVTEST